ncbi:MAG TPA: hypothetical protein VN193_16580 [Candidatus Angelobacter sp.]|jgi:hypothetical protein|nr:hypothetical protein [Candidatus Angelobacter sp.]
MRHRTFMRGLVGTLFMFVILVVITFGVIWGEKLLENFKAH